MMEAARDAAKEASSRANVRPPLVIAVTVLTSIGVQGLHEIGCGAQASDEDSSQVLEQVVRLARLSEAAGLDGVVASPLETAILRKTCGPAFSIVTPGIRGGGATTSGKDDQQRTMTARAEVALVARLCSIEA